MGEEYIYKYATGILNILKKLDVHTDVKSEDLNKLLKHSEACNFYFIRDIKSWIEQKNDTILKQKGFEYV